MERQDEKRMKDMVEWMNVLLNQVEKCSEGGDRQPQQSEGTTAEGSQPLYVDLYIYLPIVHIDIYI